MNFQIAAIGHSFRGSMAYYLHDKRQEQDAAHPVTAERVAWTETRNLAGVGPHTATRMMIATAQSAAELKAAAGGAASGRKGTSGPVFSFSLQWRADELGEGDHRAEMTAAADHVLKQLGLIDRQAVLVAHTDRAHPHVHVIVNRVDPGNGKQAVIRKPDVQKLDRWANDYERARGKIVSPNRAAKYDAIEEKRRQHPDPEERRAFVIERDRRRKEEQAAGIKAQTDAAMLKELTDAQRARHKAAWPDLSAQNKAARETIWQDYGDRIKATAARHKELTRPLWAQHFRQERQAAEAFAARERAALGIIANALAAAKHQMARGDVPGRGLLSLTFANVLSGQARAAAFTAQQEQRRGDLARELRHARDQETAALKDQRAAALAQQRQAFDKARAELIEQQTAERAKIRDAWRQHYVRHGRQPIPRATQEREPMREDYDRARRLAGANPAPHPTDRRHVSTPAPQPAPAGVPPMTARQVQDVPRAERPTMPETRSSPHPAKDWTKAAQPVTPMPAKDWTRAATPAPDAPLPAKDWSAKPEPSREIKPLPPRNRDRDRER